MQLIAGMTEEYGQTMLLVSHDNEASAYADRIVYIKDGEIEDIETRDKYYEKFGMKECAINA